jgi:ribokinase
MARAGIVVVGSSNTDLTVFTGYLPSPGETVLGGKLERAGGGKGANQAVAAARAGGQVAFVARVGDDDFGHSTLGNLKQEGICADFVTIDPEAASGVALIMVEKSGENLIAVAPGANARLTPADVHAAREAIAEADVLLVQLEIPLETVAAAVHAAREAGTRVMLNPAPAPPEGLADEVLRGIDYLTPNTGEAARLLDAPPDLSAGELAEGLVAAGVGAVALTLGASGVCVHDGSTHAVIAAPKVEPVDTVGAGDCFAGALAVALAEGMPLRRAAHFAVCAAALSVERVGAQPSMPRRAEIDRLVGNHPAD